MTTTPDSADHPSRDPGNESQPGKTTVGGPPAGPPAVGAPEQIGPYRVIAVLGRGGQGTVYRATHSTLGRDVAVKIADARLPEEAQRRLLEEGRVLASLDDPGLIRVHDAGLHEGLAYVAFEYVSGRTLAEKVRGTVLGEREAVELVAQLAATLERVHRAGVLHRDLKPANVLIDVAGRPRLMDLGSALMSVPYDGLGVREEYSGTPAYMSPEQANGPAERVGPASDVFGLAAILYALLTGLPPYPGINSRDVWRQARVGRVTPAAFRNPEIPAPLARILDKGLAPDPAERYRSAAEFGRALRGYLRLPAWRVALLIVAVGVVGACLFAAARTWRDGPALSQPGGGSTTAAYELAPRPRLEGWREFELDGEYAAVFPTNPSMKVGKTHPKGHPTRQALAIDERSNSGFSVTTSPYRDRVPTPQAALRARRDEVLRQAGAMLTQEREIAIDGHPGADASGYAAAGPFQGHWVRLRVYLVRDRFYVLAAMGREPHRADDIEVTWFFESFRLLDPKRKVP